MTMKKRIMTAAVSVALAAVAGWGNAASAQQQAVKLEKGDHVTLIGNTLADRMQHYGWLETLTYSSLPDQELVFRNLGFSGDEVAFRDRSKDFGTPDEWLWLQRIVPGRQGPRQVQGRLRQVGQGHAG